MTVDFSSPAVASFIGTLMVVLLSRIFSVWKKCPITVFLISGIFPLVPGASVYYTAYYFVTGDMALASQMGISSIKIAFSHCAWHYIYCIHAKTVVFFPLLEREDC